MASLLGVAASLTGLTIGSARLPATPQPYDQLASTVQSQCNGTLAKGIRYPGRKRESSRAKAKRLFG